MQRGLRVVAIGERDALRFERGIGDACRLFLVLGDAHAGQGAKGDHDKSAYEKPHNLKQVLGSGAIEFL